MSTNPSEALARLLSRFERPNKLFGTSVDTPEEYEVVEEPEEEHVLPSDLIYIILIQLSQAVLKKPMMRYYTTVIMFDVSKVGGSDLFHGLI